MTEWERVFKVQKRYNIDQEESEKLKVNQQIPKPITHKQLAPFEQQKSFGLKPNGNILDMKKDKVVFIYTNGFTLVKLKSIIKRKGGKK